MSSNIKKAESVNLNSNDYITKYFYTGVGWHGARACKIFNVIFFYSLPCVIKSFLMDSMLCDFIYFSILKFRNYVLCGSCRMSRLSDFYNYYIYTNSPVSIVIYRTYSVRKFLVQPVSIDTSLDKDNLWN